MPPAPPVTGGSLSVAERMARLLGVVPWVVERGGAHVDEIAARFDYPRDRLLADLTDVLFFVGVHPFTPDTLIEVDIVDETVEIRYADWFRQPLRLTGEEATRLLAAGRTVLDMSAGFGQDMISDEVEAAPLMRALTKLSLSLGDDTGHAVDHIDVCLGDAPAATLDAVRRATEQQSQIEIEYYSLGRDALTVRTVDPARVLSHDGAWYLLGWCHRAGAERVFRVDRIRALKVTDTAVAVELPVASSPSVKIGDVDQAVTLRLEPEASWVVDYYPTQRRVELEGGRVEATLAVASTPWLARLLVQLGPNVAMVARDDAIDADLQARTAGRVLERYRR